MRECSGREQISRMRQSYFDEVLLLACVGWCGFASDTSTAASAVAVEATATSAGAMVMRLVLTSALLCVKFF